MSYQGNDVAPALREIAQLALAEGNVDLAWVAAFLSVRDDLAVGARFADEELARLAGGESVRVGLRELRERGLLEVRLEREGRPSAAWSVFVREPPSPTASAPTRG